MAHNGPDSTKMQDGQRFRLERYAKEHGFEIVGGSSDLRSILTLNRPRLLNFRGAADGKVDIFFIASPA